MYLLYLDDSGSPENKSEDYFVLGGVCVPERSINWLTTRLDDFAKEINSEDPSQIEFHASEIFSGRRLPWSDYDRNGRKDLLKRTLKTLEDSNSDTVVFACAVHKASNLNIDPMEIAFEDLCSRFDLYLNRVYRDTKVSHKGIIVCDENVYQKSLQKLSREFRQGGTRWRNIRNIREVPFFVDSKMSRLIQLADHIAYSVFRRYNAGDLTYFNCIEGQFDKDGDIIHGLSNKQNYNPNCTCPACMSRK
jgi:hypothetical protein